MITKFKIFESINNDKPKVGDYVIVNMDCKFNTIEYEKSIEIFNNNVCQITKIENFNSFEVKCEVNNDFWWVKRSEIVEFSDNKDKLQTLLDARKFNV